MENEQPCPKCQSDQSYFDGSVWVCSACFHEWNESAASAESESSNVIRDAVGNILADGDNVTVVRDLKINGGSGVIKVGTKAKNIRLLEEPINGHDIACKVDGHGQMNLKSSVVKKS